jgi:hypothetical protein
MFNLIRSNYCIGCKQGDQIGPNFTQRVIVYLGQLLENFRGILYFWAILFYCYGCA